jgi:adenylate cyclase
LRKRFFYGVLLVALISIGTEAAMRADWLEMPENLYYDLWHQLAGKRYQPQHVVIVAIDDRSRLKHLDEPLVFWSPHFAQAIEVSRSVGVGVIGLDYLFLVSAESWLRKLNVPGSDQSRTHDLPFREQLASGKVVLAGNIVLDEQGKRKVLLPIWDYWNSLPGKLDDVGLTNFYSDPDGVIRRFLPVLTDDDGEAWVTFAKLLAERAARPETASERQSLRHICFAGPPGTIPRISFRRLLTPGTERDSEIQSLKDKVIIIASESSALPDFTLTPYARSFLNLGAHMMSGAELHANIVETLLSGRFQRPLPMFFRLVYLVTVLIAGTALFLWLSPWRGLAAACLISLICSIISYLLFRRYWILPVSSVQLGLVLSYLGAVGIRLTGEERARAHLREVFGRYASKEVVEKLLTSGKQPNLGGEALQVTVLFLDIRNFTTISEHLKPHQVVELLNTFFTRACKPIMEYGGIVDKFIGDAVMAVFGSPVPYPDHARRAILTALAMTEIARDFCSWMPRHFAEKGLPDFGVGIGLHTGEVIVGNIGAPERLEFTAIGDTVNLASRLERLAKELKWNIVASSDIIKAAGPGVVTGRQEIHYVKGRKEPIEVFEVIGMDSE